VAAPDPGYPWLAPQFGALATVLAVAAVAFLLFVQPVWGRRKYQRLVAERPTNPRALLDFYRRALARQAVWIAVAVLVLVTSRGVQPRELGLALPTGGHLRAAFGWTGYGLAMIVLGAVLMRRRALRGRTVPGQGVVIALIPATAAERRLGAAVAVGAGVSEELLCRGLLIAAGVGLLGLSAAWSVILSSVVFGAAHLYQGALPMIGISLLGLALGALYLGSQSLLLPVVLHAALDLRGLVFVPAQRADARERAH
jgi:uncharacterized protein